jgi:alpha-ketoglutarate-dependent taurine dioxygenase
MLDVRPVTPVIGAEVYGIDLSRPLAPDIIDALRAAWLEHLVLFFVDQELTPAHALDPVCARATGERWRHHVRQYAGRL